MWLYYALTIHYNSWIQTKMTLGMTNFKGKEAFNYTSWWHCLIEVTNSYFHWPQVIIFLIFEVDNIVCY